MSLYRVCPDEIVKLWEIARPYIKMAVDYQESDYELSDILGSIVDGEYTLWIGTVDGETKYAGVTHIGCSASRQYLWVSWLGGTDMDDWVHGAMAELEEIARGMDLDGIKIEGRPGWERLMKVDGFRKTHTVLTKRLT